MKTKIRRILCVILLLNSFASFSQSVAPTVTATGNQIYCPQSQQNIVSSFDITDPDSTNTSGFYIQISTGYVVGEDQLILTGTHPNIIANWNPSEAKLILSPSGGSSISYLDIVAAVYDVVFISSNINVSAKTFSLTIGEANYLPNGHYYEFIPSQAITWTAARATADLMNYYGMQGYLVTITDAAESQIAGELSLGTGWIGGNDAESEGVWKWVTGPEAGTTFWNGGPGGSAPAGMFENWNNNEPNNSNNEDFAHITDPSIGPPGSWNDLPNSTSGQGTYEATGFVVEYGGMPGDPVLSISANTIFNPPQILSTSPSVSCSNEAANLQATSNTDDIEWWDSQTGGTLLGTGTSFNPVLSEDTIFWVYPSNNGCSNGTRTSVSATVNLAPLPTVPTPYDLCDIDTDGTLSNDGLALFDLSTKESEILNGQTDVTISFHLSPTNALDGSNPVSTSFINTSPYSELLFVRLENATSNCYAITTLTVNVLPSISTSFNQLDPVCEGVTFTLPLTSNEGIAGNWSPAINNALTTEYTFTTDAGQCADEATMTVVVEPVITPGFTAIDPVCEGVTLNDLPTTSNEGITGTWTPALDNTLTTNYTFTPGPDQCAIPSNLTITINQKADPLFGPIGSICDGDSLNALPNTSINGVTGTWSPALDNTQTTTYLFTPNFNQCANTTNTIITVLPNSTSTFDQLDPICEGDAFALPLTSIEGITGTWSPAIDNTTSTLYTFSPDPGQCASEASMAITVIPVITPTFTQVETICVGDTLLNLSTTSNNSITGTWSPAIDNTTTTEYTFTPNVGLSCVLPVTMTITVLTQTVPEFTQVDPICIGSTITPLPQISTNGITGTWFPSSNNLQTTSYTFSSDPGQCAGTTAMTIIVNPISTLTVSATNLSEDFDSNQVISVLATGGSGSYEYQLDGGPWQQEAVFEYVTGCDEHIVAVRDLFGCSTMPESTIMIMEYPKFFTPNGDSFNDRWNIKCLKDNPLAKIRIFDRFGKLLLDFKPNQNDWDGTLNGQLLPGSDYWFVASYLNSNGIETQFRSHFSLRY